MSDEVKPEKIACPQCEDHLVEIDYYGDILAGCFECNLWRKNGESHLISLPAEDLEALRERRAQTT